MIMNRTSPSRSFFRLRRKVLGSLHAAACEQRPRGGDAHALLRLRLRLGELEPLRGSPGHRGRSVGSAPTGSLDLAGTFQNAPGHKNPH